MLGLWRESQGCPKTTGAKGESVRKKEIVSVWLPEVMRLTDSVTWVTGGRDWPQRALTKMGELSGTTGTPNWSAVLWSKKLPSAPESIKALHVNAARSTSNWTGRRVAAEEEDFSKTTPPVSNLLSTGGLWLLPGTAPQYDPQHRSINIVPGSCVSPSPPVKDELCPPAWVQNRKHDRPYS